MEVPYLAGIIDGEGHVSVTKRNHQKGRYQSYILILDVAGKNTSLITAIVDSFGGRLRYDKKYKVMHVVWRNTEARKILKICLPYLIVKKDLALLGIRFDRFRSKHQKQRPLAHPGRYGRIGYPKKYHRVADIMSGISKELIQAQYQ